MDELSDRINEQLINYNQALKKPMNLVLFDFAIMHLLRVCRILKMDRGNALLIGLGGSGRESISILAAWLMDQVLEQTEQAKNYNQEQWCEDIKVILFKTGCEEQKTMFLLTDTQLKYSFIMEDINNLINQYEIPNLFKTEDRIQIEGSLRLKAEREGEKQLAEQGT